MAYSVLIPVQTFFCYYYVNDKNKPSYSPLRRLLLDVIALKHIKILFCPFFNFILMNIQQSSLRCILCEWAHRWIRIWNTNEWKSSMTVSRALHLLSASTWPRGRMSERFRLEGSKESQETCSKYSRLGFISSFKHIFPLNMALLLMWYRINFLATIMHGAQGDFTYGHVGQTCVTLENKLHLMNLILHSDPRMLSSVKVGLQLCNWYTQTSEAEDPSALFSQHATEMQQCFSYLLFVPPEYFRILDS